MEYVQNNDSNSNAAPYNQQKQMASQENLNICKQKTGQQKPVQI